MLRQLEGRDLLLGLLLYGSGMRHKEVLRLRVKDVHFDTMQITVRDGKGEKDRVTMLPKAGNVDQPATLHTLRRSFAGDLLEDGDDIRTVQELLGHIDVKSMMIHTHLLNKPGLAVRNPADVMR